MAPLSIACSSLKGSLSTRSPSPREAEVSTQGGSIGSPFKCYSDTEDQDQEDRYFSMMFIKVHKLRFNHPMKRCYFKIRIGDEFYIHTPLLETGNETEFDFKGLCYHFNVSFHSQVFDYLQIDIYEPNTWRRSKRIGRMLLRLSHLHSLPYTFSSWFEILDLEDATQELLGSRNFSYIYPQSIGAIELTIRYRYQSLSHLTQSISPFTLKSSSMRKGSFPNLYMTPPNPDDDEQSSIDAPGEHIYPQESRTKYLCWIQFLSHFMDDDTFVAVMSIQKLLFAFGQGLNISRRVFTMAVKLTSKFYARIPMKRTEKFVIDAGFIQHVARIFQYASAAFGWMGLNYSGHGRGILYDVFRFQADRKCIIEFLSIPSQDLLELELEHDELFRPSYFIALDRELDAVMLTIRGSMSVIDIITDLACHYQPWQGGLVHSGIYTAARWIIDNVMERVIFYKEKYNMKRIIITGHSLGAAISAAVGMMVREGEQYDRSPSPSPILHHRTRSSATTKTSLISSKDNPFYHERANIFSYCYGCPPLVSAELVPLSEVNTFTFNYGNDLVPHLSYGSMMDYRVMLLTAAKLIKTRHVLFSPGSNTTSLVMHALTVCREELKIQNQHPKLMCPGQYHHMHVLDEVPRDKTDPKFKWTVMEKSNAVDFSEFCIYRHMWSHHLPIKYERAFYRIYESIQRRNATMNSNDN